MKCEYCGRYVEDGVYTCPSCGAHIKQEAHYCVKCGNKLNGDEKVCPFCNTPTDKTADAPSTFMGERDEKSIGFALIGFFLPLIGIIFYLVWRKEYPLRAKSAGKGALVSIILIFLFYGGVIGTFSCFATNY